MYSQEYPLTIAVWQSEFKRLQTRYDGVSDKSSPEARGYIDHMQAVESIMKDVSDSAHTPFLVVIR